MRTRLTVSSVSPRSSDVVSFPLITSMSSFSSISLASSIRIVPSMTPLMSTSMFSAIVRAVRGFPVTLMVGETGCPMGLPIPVEKMIACGPAGRQGGYVFHARTGSVGEDGAFLLGAFTHADDFDDGMAPRFLDGSQAFFLDGGKSAPNVVRRPDSNR